MAIVQLISPHNHGRSCVTPQSSPEHPPVHHLSPCLCSSLFVCVPQGKECCTGSSSRELWLQGHIPAVWPWERASRSVDCKDGHRVTILCIHTALSTLPRDSGLDWPRGFLWQQRLATARTFALPFCCSWTLWLPCEEPWGSPQDEGICVAQSPCHCGQTCEWGHPRSAGCQLTH